MSGMPVERPQFSTVRAHKQTGSLAGLGAVVPVTQFSMYYNGLFIP